MHPLPPSPGNGRDEAPPRKSSDADEPALTWFGQPSLLALPILLASVFFHSHFAKKLFYFFPLPWPDEALFAQPAWNLLHRGQLSTDLLAGLLPGIATHTYWVPPVYFLYLSVFFALFGFGLAVIRLASVFAGLTILGLVYFIARKCGLSRRASALPLSFALLSVTFFKGAHVGRMDCLALALMLGAIAFFIQSRGAARRPRLLALSGLLCGLAGLTHPFGIVSFLAILGCLVAEKEKRGTRFAIFAVPVVFSLCLWALYCLVDWNSFLSQFGGQFFRKTGGNRLDPATLFDSYSRIASQHGFSILAVSLWWLAGLAGLSATAVSRRSLRVLPVFQLLALGMVVWGRSNWYTLYIVPLTGVGFVLLVQTCARGRPVFKALACVLAGFAGWFIFNNVQQIRHEAEYQQALGPRGDFSYWSRQISQAIPDGAKIFLAVLPDPSCELLKRPGLRLRQFVPEGIPVRGESLQAELQSSDYIVLGRIPLSPEVHRFARTKGILAKEINDLEGEGFYAAIYRIPK